MDPFKQELPADIWVPANSFPDLRYCCCLLHHAAKQMEDDFDAFQYELAKHRQTYRDAFIVLRDHLQASGLNPDWLTL